MIITYFIKIVLNVALNVLMEYRLTQWQWRVIQISYLAKVLQSNNHIQHNPFDNYY